MGRARLARPFYRSRQVLLALFPRLSEGDLAAVREILGPGEVDLFLAMEKRDQRHAIEVMRRVRRSRPADRDLLAAALLHDCAKGSVPVWLRILYVLSPTLVRRLGRPAGSRWQAAAQRLADHAVIGPALAAEAGASAATVRYIAGTVPPADSDRMALLRAADDAS